MTSGAQSDGVRYVGRGQEGLVLALSTVSLAAWTLSLTVEPRPVAWFVGPLWMGSVAALASLPARLRVRAAVLVPPWGALAVSLAFEVAARVYASPGWWGLLLAQGLVVAAPGVERFHWRRPTVAPLPWRPWVWVLAPGVAIALSPDPSGERYRADVMTLALAWCAALWILVVWPLSFARTMVEQTRSRLGWWIRGAIEGLALLAWAGGAPYILTGQWGLALTLQALSLCLVYLAYGSNVSGR